MGVRVRVKICGITRQQDASQAAWLGADAIGLVFYPPSPRAVTVAQARAIVAGLPPFVTTVGLFVDPQAEAVAETLAEVPLDLLQFHGQERREQCEGFGRPYIKAIRMKPHADLFALAESYASAQALLLDSYVPGVAGGTGVAFDWQRIPPRFPKPLILAGGLTPDNVAEAIRLARPYAVDVSGGVETGKGIKDSDKMAAFIRQARQP